jgi:hypothetical protein
VAGIDERARVWSAAVMSGVRKGARVWGAAVESRVCEGACVWGAAVVPGVHEGARIRRHDSRVGDWCLHTPHGGEKQQEASHGATCLR